MFSNPFAIYILSFGAVLVAYQLGWSDAYPQMSLGLSAFFAGTFVVAALLARYVSRDLRQFSSYVPGLMPGFVVWLMVCSLAADVAYTGYFPLFSAFGTDFLYSGEIGVPSLHVFNVTFGASFSAIRFADFLYSKRPRYLIEALVPVIYFLLILYRGPIIMLFITWSFIVVARNGLNLRRGLTIGALGCAILFVFGKVGDLREGGSEAIVKLGKPSTAFETSGVPAAYFWTFIYMTSPMANLQLAVETKLLDNNGAVKVLVGEMLPDVISKRIFPLLTAGHPLLPVERVETPEVSRGLNVATLYGRAAVLMGWPGLVIMFAELCAIILVYLHLIRHSPFRVPSLALLNCFIVFCTFQNMIAHSGVMLQLVWPLLLPMILSTGGLRNPARQGHA